MEFIFGMGRGIIVIRLIPQFPLTAMPADQISRPGGRQPSLPCRALLSSRHVPDTKRSNIGPRRRTPQNKPNLQIV